MKKQQKQTRKALELLAFDDVLHLDDGRELPVKLDEDVIQKITDITTMLFHARGIKVEVAPDDPEAARIARRQLKRRNARKLSAEEAQQVVGGIRNIHAPHETAARAAAVTLAIVDSHDVLFALREIGGGVVVDPLPPYDDLEIPDGYFDQKPKSAFRQLMEKSGNLPVEPRLNADHPIEIMLAYVADLLNKNPALNEALQPYIERGYVAWNTGGVRLDEEQEKIFRDLMDGILLERVGEPDADEQRAEPGAGTHDAAEPVGEAE